MCVCVCVGARTKAAYERARVENERKSRLIKEHFILLLARPISFPGKSVKFNPIQTCSPPRTKIPNRAIRGDSLEQNEWHLTFERALFCSQHLDRITRRWRLLDGNFVSVCVCVLLVNTCRTYYFWLPRNARKAVDIFCAAVSRCARENSSDVYIDTIGEAAKVCPRRRQMEFCSVRNLLTLLKLEGWKEYR